MGNRKRAKTYYSLVGRAKSGWEVIFGDWTKRVVSEEEESVSYSNRMGDRYYKRFKILETDGLQASIDHAVRRLNLELVS